MRLQLLHNNRWVCLACEWVVAEVVAQVVKGWAAANDDLAKTVHYGELANALVAAAKANPVDLIETLATRLLELVMNFGGGEATGIVKKARITVHKPKAPIEHEFSDVSVRVKAKRK